MSSSKTTDTLTEEHADHPAQKAQDGGCCGGHEHGPVDAATQGDGHDTEEHADRPAQKAQDGGC